MPLVRGEKHTNEKGNGLRDKINWGCGAGVYKINYQTVEE